MVKHSDAYATAANLINKMTTENIHKLCNHILFLLLCSSEAQMRNTRGRMAQNRRKREKNRNRNDAMGLIYAIVICP